MDRDDTLRRAEKLLRQGRLDAAITEYARVVEGLPSDWATAKVLGDLYVRAGQIDQAVRQYTRIAEHLVREGFVPKAAALYKKIVKIRPDDDAALLRMAELSAQQGLTADARVHLQALFEQRVRRGDRRGAAHAAAAQAELDPGDPAGRLESARMLAEVGDPMGAAAQLRAAGEVLHAGGKTAEGIEAWRGALRFNPDDEGSRGLLIQAMLELGDPDGARALAKSAADWHAVATGFERAGAVAEAYDALGEALRADPTDVAARVHLARAAIARHDDAAAKAALAPVADSAEPLVQFALAEVEIRSGAVERGQAALERCLVNSEDLVGPSIDLGCAIGPGDQETGFAVITTVVRWAEARGDTDLALDAIERFLAVVPDDVVALQEFIRACGLEFYEHRRYRAQVRLADVFLAREMWREARSLAEQLVAARLDDPSHLQRLTRALTGLRVPAAEAAVRAYVRRAANPAALSDFGPSSQTQSALAEDTSGADVAVPPVAWAVPASGGPRLPMLVPPESTGGRTPWTGAPAASDAGPKGRDAGPGATREAPGGGSPDRDVFEMDLSGELDDLLGVAGTAAPARTGDSAKPGLKSPPDLDGFFHGLREWRGRDIEDVSAAFAYDQASEHFNRGDIESAMTCLRTAARDPNYRFRAASMLARIARDHQRLGEAVEWLERAAVAPPPTLEASHSLLYELGDILEVAGEDARSLAVFIELQSIVPGFRDVGARIANLNLRQTGRPQARKGLP